ncbi:hypothetical protein [Lactiplantibacillus plantarum]|uniref:hypothetical protein n=1 Tax=Lactiplantibacillus plantarum TaxID=1590 RepID=UPI0021CB0DC1|nr:hypothetical protein [Lactiplantibacillus plantarum]
MEKIPEVKVHLADLKALYNAGYEVLTKLRKEANSPVVEAHFLNQKLLLYMVEMLQNFL